MEQRIERGKRRFYNGKLYSIHSAFIHKSMEMGENSKDTARVRCEYTKSSVPVMVTWKIADGIMYVATGWKKRKFFSSHDYVINIAKPL